MARRRTGSVGFIFNFSRNSISFVVRSLEHGGKIFGKGVGFVDFRPRVVFLSGRGTLIMIQEFLACTVVFLYGF